MKTLAVIVVATLVLVGYLLFQIVSLALAAGGDPRIAQCGGNSDNVEAAFDIPAARDVWNYLPAMGKSPHLARDDQPAFVVLFRPDFEVTTFLQDPWDGSSTASNYGNVVCVIQSDGEAHVFADVSRDGFRAP